MKEAVMGVVAQHFRPEFLNRIDDAVVFRPLEKLQILGVARIQLKILQQRLKESELCLELSDEAIDFLVDVGYDPVFGARPLKRAIQRYVEDPLAKQILAGTVGRGEKICGERDGDLLVFNS
jgi:ATP-dependent Clp protease ATP-binding subunit ClpB